jgi:hypothetical protein
MGVPPSASPPPAVRTLWTHITSGSPRGLALARERGWVLTWDDKNWLYLLSHKGEVQAQKLSRGQLVAAAGADDGSAYATAGSRGEVTWLAPDLMPRWERSIPDRAVALALDPFGQYLAVSDVQARLFFFDRCGRPVGQCDCPRPLHHLAFVPAAAYLIGCSDYGLVACYDLAGRCAWRDGLVAHVGALAVSGDGQRSVLACYTDGLQCYSLAGQRLARVPAAQPCRLAAQSFDGQLILAAGLTNQLFLLDAEGQSRCNHSLDKPSAALALGALGDRAVVALAGGPVLGLDLSGR